LRSPQAVTSYQRSNGFSPSMWALDPEQVFSALEKRVKESVIVESS